ncbi:MAG: hypothetical protein F4Z33_05850 [Gemmatimonadales bacterium]|nr:hypothetical protein [Gemmatimonadales bacterium]MXX78487.1 hypothetical protein [Gemmatimonadales bacterium]MYC88190.1 hypothetical protein [Candidatus Palauibacter denitrificans]
MKHLRRDGAIVKPILLVAGLGVVGCGGSGGDLDDDTYVQVMARLSWARAKYADTTEGDSVRAAALDEHGVTGQQLEEFVARLGDDPGRMHRLWEAIRLEVDVLDGVSRPESQLEMPDAERRESR